MQHSPSRSKALHVKRAHSLLSRWVEGRARLLRDSFGKAPRHDSPRAREPFVQREQRIEVLR
jgi:hypothetical protein